MTRFLLLLFFSHYIHSAGFGDHTLLLTKDGHTTFDEVNLNTCIQSHKNTFQPVLFFSKQTVANIVHITIADETIICHKKQRFGAQTKTIGAMQKTFYQVIYYKQLMGNLLQSMQLQ